MQWGSIGDFLAMGGYGLYVWPSLVVTAVTMLGEVWALRRRYLAALAASDRLDAAQGGAQ
jgi:heme exporter protein D